VSTTSREKFGFVAIILALALIVLGLRDILG
jgi:hypothetical protein